MTFPRAPRASLAAILIAPLAIGCSANHSRAKYWGRLDPPAGQELRYVSGSEPESLDPQIGSGAPEARMYLALFDGLTENDPKTSEPIPSMAERWEINSDNTEFTFHLRHDLRWSDGTPITANDFVYSLRRGLSPELAARYAYIAYYVQYAQAYNEGDVFVRDRSTHAFLSDPASPDRRLTLPGDPADRTKALTDPALSAARSQDYVPVRAEDVGIEALDDYTLCYRLDHSAPFFIGLMAHQFFRPVPRQAIEKYGDAWTQPGHMVSSGAFVLSVWKPYDRIIVIRNPDFWDAARVRLDRMTFYALDDVTTIMNLYKAGDIDATYPRTVPSAWIDEIRHFGDYMDAPEAGNEFYLFNTTKAPMNDVRVRRAFNMAVDKTALAAFRRVAKPIDSFIPAGIFPGYPVVHGDGFDPAAARALLAEAGYRDATGHYDPSRFPVSDVEATYNTLDTNRQVAEFLQAQWRQNLGLTISIKNMEWKTFLDDRANLRYNGMARSAWGADYMDPFTFLNIFYTPAGDNGTGWWDPKYVALLDDANRQADPAKRYAMLARAEKMLLDAQPVMPLFVTATNWLKKPYVRGMFPNPTDLYPWKFVYIEHDPSKWDDPDPDPAAGAVVH